MPCVLPGSLIEFETVTYDRNGIIDAPYPGAPGAEADMTKRPIDTMATGRDEWGSGRGAGFEGGRDRRGELERVERMGDRRFGS